MYNLINKVDEITAYHGGAFFYFWKVVKHVVCSRMNWQMVSYFQENMLWEAWKTDFWLFENSRVGGRLFCKAYWKPFFEKCTGTLIAYTTTDWPDLFFKSIIIFSIQISHLFGTIRLFFHFCEMDFKMAAKRDIFPSETEIFLKASNCWIFICLENLFKCNIFFSIEFFNRLDHEDIPAWCK